MRSCSPAQSVLWDQVAVRPHRLPPTCRIARTKWSQQVQLREVWRSTSSGDPQIRSASEALSCTASTSMMAPTSPIDWECSSGAYLPHQYACRRDGRCPSLTEGTPPASASTTQVAQPRRPHGRGPSSCGPALSWVIWWSAGPSGVPSIACDGKVNVLSTLSAFQGTHSRNYPAAQHTSGSVFRRLAVQSQ